MVETMDTWATQRCPSDFGNENVDSYNKKGRNCSHEEPRSKVVSFLEPQERQDSDVYGNNSEESTEVELRDDDSQIPAKKRVLFRASSRGSGRSRSEALVTRDAPEDDEQSHTSRWSISSRKQRHGRFFSRSMRHANAMAEPPIVKSIVKETETFLHELNESLDQPESDGVLVEDEKDSAESCKEVIPETPKDESLSLLDSAWKMFAMHEPMEINNAKTEEKHDVLQDTLRMLGFVKPASDVPLEKSDGIDTARTVMIHEETETLDTDINPTVIRVEEKENQDLATGTGQLSVAEIASTISADKRKKRGLLMRRSRKKVIELDAEEDLASQFVPLVDDEGVQIIPTDGGTALSSDEKDKATGKRDKVSSMLSRIKRKVKSRRKHQIETRTKSPEVNITEKETQIDGDMLHVAESASVYTDIEQTNEQVKDELEPKSEEPKREVASGTTNEIDASYLMMSIQDVLTALTPAWPFPDPFHVNETSKGGEVNDPSSKSFNQEKRHLVKILNSDFSSATQKRKAEIRLREMFESRKSSSSSRSASRRPPLSTDEDSSAYFSTNLSEEDTETEFTGSASTVTEVSVTPALSTDGSIAGKVQETPVNRKTSSAQDDHSQENSSHQSAIPTAMAIAVNKSSSSVRSLRERLGLAPPTRQNSQSSRSFSGLISKGSIDSSIQHKYTPVLDLSENISEDPGDVALRYTPLQDLSVHSSEDKEAAESSPSQTLATDSTAGLEEQMRTIADKNITSSFHDSLEDDTKEAHGSQKSMDPIATSIIPDLSVPFDAEAVDRFASVPLDKSVSLDMSASVSSGVAGSRYEKNTAATDRTVDKALETTPSVEDIPLEGVSSQSLTEGKSESVLEEVLPTRDSLLDSSGQTQRKVVTVDSNEIVIVDSNLSANPTSTTDKTPGNAAPIVEEAIENEQVNGTLENRDSSVQEISIEKVEETVQEEDICVIDEEKLINEMNAARAKKKLADQRKKENIMSIRNLVTSLRLDTFDPKTANVTGPVHNRSNQVTCDSATPRTTQEINRGSIPRSEESSLTTTSHDEGSCTRSRASVESASKTIQRNLELSPSPVPSASLHMENDSLSGSQANVEPVSRMSPETIGSHTLRKIGLVWGEGTCSRPRTAGITAWKQRYLANAARTSIPKKLKTVDIPESGFLIGNNSEESKATSMSSVIRDVARAASMDISPSLQSIITQDAAAARSSEISSQLVTIPEAEMETLKNHAKILGIDVGVLIAARMA